MAAQIFLIVDDLLAREELAEALALQGYQVMLGDDRGESVLTQIREYHPNLVIIEALLPRMDGIAVSEILSREQLAPVVLLTEDLTPAQFAHVNAAGVMACLMRPWNAQRLTPTIEIALARYTELQALHVKFLTLDAQLTMLQTQERARGQEQQRVRALTDNASRHPFPPTLPGLTVAESFLYWLWQRYIDDNPQPPL